MREVEDVSGGGHDLRLRLAGWSRGAMEAVLLGLVVLAPWAAGAVAPPAESLLLAGVALLLALEAACLLLEGTGSWPRCPVAWCLAGLLLLGAAQLLPLPAGLLGGLSPATARLYGRLLPGRPEELPFGAGAAGGLSWRSLSVYPHATRREVVRLLAATAVFVLVRRRLASARALRRLGWAALATGALLAVYGLARALAGAEQAAGPASGPFVNRNHFACHLNLCLGLALGLLLRHYAPAPPGQTAPPAGGWPDRGNPRRLLSPGRLLEHPETLWIGLALVLMATGVIFSLSRGGILALLGGASVLLAVRLACASRFSHLEAGLLIAAATLALLTWFGLDRVEARLATLWHGEALQNDRWALLGRSSPLVRAFPLWGTGYGTLDQVEPLSRTDPRDAGWAYRHAHNEYLEALLEGGVVRLFLSVLAIGLVFRLGYRAFRRHVGDGTGGLILGALLAFSTLAIHSLIEFGVHIPAITLLTAVIAAHLSGLGAQAADVGGSALAAPTGATDPRGSRLGGLAALTAAVACICVGLTLYGEGWKESRAWTFQRAAREWGRHTDAASLEHRIASLAAASQVDPSDARLHYLLAEAYSDRFDVEAQYRARAALLTAAAAAVVQPAAGCAAAATAAPPGGPSLAWLAGHKAQDVRERKELDELARRHQLPALRHYLLARDLCPLMVKPHMRIAAYVNGLARAEPYRTYLERAQLLDPSDPELWYRCGILERRHGQDDQAWRDWRRSLELSDLYLPEILQRSSRALRPREILDKVLPDRPAVLLEAARRLFPGPDAGAGQRPFLAKTLELLERQSAPLAADDWHVKAVSHAALGQPAEAVAAFEAALLAEPQQAEWRYELAKLLYEQGRLREAQCELLIVLDQQAAHGPANELLHTVTLEMAEGPKHPAAAPR